MQFHSEYLSGKISERMIFKSVRLIPAKAPSTVCKIMNERARQFIIAEI